MAVAVQTDMAVPPVAKFGTDEQKQRYLTPAIKGEKIFCLGITEPDAGSDVAGIKTTARKSTTGGSSTVPRSSSRTAGAQTL